EATTQELLFIFSPILTAGVVALAGPRQALLMLSVLSLVGALGFTHALRRADVTGPTPVGDKATGRSQQSRRSLLRTPALLVLFLMSFLTVGGIIGVDLAIVAWANELNTPQYVMVLASV